MTSELQARMWLVAAVLAILAVLPSCKDGPAKYVVGVPAEADELVAPPIRVPVTAEPQYKALVKPDARLDSACEDLAYLVAQGGDPTTDIVTRLLQMHGIVEPPERVVSGSATEDLDSQLGDDRFKGNAVVARAVHGSTAVEMLVFIPSIRLGAVSRGAEEGANVTFELEVPLETPEVTVSDGKNASNITAVAVGHAFQAHVPCGSEPAEQYVSIEAVDPRNAIAPHLIFPLYCRLKSPSSLEVEPRGNLERLSERRIIAILNRERTSRNIPRLRHDARFSVAAAAYVKDRASGIKSEPSSILRRAGLLAPATAWTTVHVDSLASAIARILNSSDEMGKVVDRERTDVGAAMQKVDDGWWVSIVYVTMPKSIDTDHEAFLISNMISSVSKRSSRDSYADTVAQRYADGLAAGWSNDPLRLRALADLGTHIGGSPQVIVERRVEVDALDVPSLVSKYQFRYFGIGVAQSAHDGALTGTIWIVVMIY